MAGQTTLTATGNPLAGVSLEGARCIDFDDHDVIKHQNMRLLAVKSKTGSFLAPRMFVPCLEGLEHPRVPGIAKLTRIVAHRNEHRE